MQSATHAFTLGTCANRLPHPWLLGETHLPVATAALVDRPGIHAVKGSTAGGGGTVGEVHEATVARSDGTGIFSTVDFGGFK